MIFSLLLCGLLCLVPAQAKYSPDWESLDKRPLPDWFDKGKIGIFIHWGVFSVPAFGSEWFWWSWKGRHLPAYNQYMSQNYRPDFTYADFAPMFKAEFFSPEKLANLLKKAGARYVVLVSKHHEGFTSWPSKYSFNWNAMDVGPNRDIVGELAAAIRKDTDIKFGMYHSMFEWFHPLFQKDQANGFRTQDFVKAKTMPELYEIVNKYKPDVVWSDGEWMALDTYWNSPEFIAWLYNDSPVKDTVVVNDRWGNNTRCKHGGVWDCTDTFLPSHLMPHKWEHGLTMDKYSWGFRANARVSDYHTTKEVLNELIQAVSLGGNMLINVGPTSAGVIAPIMEERLTQLGAWLDVNGDAIYETKIWTHQNDTVTPNIWYTKRENGSSARVYAFLLEWPEKPELTLGAPVATSKTRVSFVGYPGNLHFTAVPGGGIKVTIPSIPVNKLPCEWAWVLRLEGLSNQDAPFNWERYAETRKNTKFFSPPTRTDEIIRN